MSNLRQAAQQALELLKQLQGGCTDSDDGTVEALTVWCPEVIANLEAALEQYDKDRVWIEERTAAWAKDKEIARKNAELERERHYTPWPCEIAKDGVCEALECCNVRTSGGLCPEQVRAQPEQVDVLAEYTGDGTHRQWVSTGAWLMPGERVLHAGAGHPPRREMEQEPVAWLRREELADLQTCNYRHLGADSPRIWAPHQPDAPDPEQDMVPVYTHPRSAARTLKAASGEG